jgi:hypothetical protein
MYNGGRFCLIWIVYFASAILILFESFTLTKSQSEFNLKDRNCSLFNLTTCDYCGPGTIFNSSKLLLMLNAKIFDLLVLF